MALERIHRLRAMLDRYFRFCISLYFLTLMLFSVAIIADSIFHLGWGYKPGDLEIVGVCGLIGVAIFLWSRVMRRFRDFMEG